MAGLFKQPLQRRPLRRSNRRSVALDDALRCLGNGVQRRCATHTRTRQRPLVPGYSGNRIRIASRNSRPLPWQAWSGCDVLDPAAGRCHPPDAASSLSPITRLWRTRHTPSTNSAQPVDPWLLCSRRYSRHRGCRLWCSQSNSTMGISMLAYVVSEGRLFALKPSEWSLLLGGVMFCGLLTLLFG